MRALIKIVAIMLFLMMLTDIYAIGKHASADVFSKSPINVLTALVPPPGQEKLYKNLIEHTYGHRARNRDTTKVISRRIDNAQTLLAKARNYFIDEEGNFIASILIYNNKNVAFKGKVAVKCQILDNDKKPLDVFQKNKDISLKPKEAILIKDINFGPTGDYVDKAHFVFCKIIPRRG